MPNTAELLVKEAEGILEQNVLVPIVLQKCAARGYTPSNEQEMEALLNVASDIREKIASGELAPAPATAYDTNGKLTKAASDILAADPFGLGEDMAINLDEVAPQVKEAAAVATWASLEAVTAQEPAAAAAAINA